MKPVSIASLLGLFAACQPALPADSSVGTADDAALFGALDTASSAALSADGKRVVYVGPGEGTSTVATVIDLADGGTRQIARADANPLSLESCNWSAADRLVCSMFGLERAGAVLLPELRTVALDADGANPLRLGERNTFDQLVFRQYDGVVVDWMKGEDGSVLMSRTNVPEKTVGKLLARTGEGLGVVRIDTRTGKFVQLERPAPDAVRYISDGLGNIRIMTTTVANETTGTLRGEEYHFYRKPDERQWRELGKYRYDGDGLGIGMLPLAVDPVINAVYVLQRLSGRQALYRVYLDGSKKEELTFASPNVDVDDVIQVGRGGRVIGVTYTDDIQRFKYFDPAYKDISDTLERVLPNLPLTSFVSASADEQVLLIHASSDVDPGRWYVYNRARKTLSEAIIDRPGLRSRTLSPMKPVTYPAADGTLIPGYLTLPPNLTAGRKLPAIVLPHGGPGYRDKWGFDWLAQYFAQRGFAVLQPNFRGSGGYGDEWYMKNGFQSWKTAVGDVCDGGRWLVKEGIADASKLVVLGWSYGGYAALQANVLDPDLFKAVVAIAPVTDLGLRRKRAYLYTDSAVVREFIGSGPHLNEGSPARNAKTFKAPVLMFHGDKDYNVEIVQSRRMDRELRAAGKSSELVVYPQLDHGLLDGAARADLLRRSDAFLRTKLGM